MSEDGHTLGGGELLADFGVVTHFFAKVSDWLFLAVWAYTMDRRGHLGFHLVIEVYARVLVSF